MDYAGFSRILGLRFLNSPFRRDNIKPDSMKQPSSEVVESNRQVCSKETLNAAKNANHTLLQYHEPKNVESPRLNKLDNYKLDLKPESNPELYNYSATPHAIDPRA